MSLESQINAPGGLKVIWERSKAGTEGSERHNHPVLSFDVPRCSCLLGFFLGWRLVFWKEIVHMCSENLHGSHGEGAALWMQTECLHKHRLMLLIKPEIGLVMHVLAHPRDARSGPNLYAHNEQVIYEWSEPLAHFEHSEIESECLFGCYSV